MFVDPHSHAVVFVDPHYHAVVVVVVVGVVEVVGEALVLSLSLLLFVLRRV